MDRFPAKDGNRTDYRLGMETGRFLAMDRSRTGSKRRTETGRFPTRDGNRTVPDEGRKQDGSRTWMKAGQISGEGRYQNRFPRWQGSMKGYRQVTDLLKQDRFPARHGSRTVYL